MTSKFMLLSSLQIQSRQNNSAFINFGSIKMANILVDDCLKKIFNRLENREDQDAFGLTCKQWFRIRNCGDSLSFGEGLKSKNSNELNTYLPKIVSRYSYLNSVYLYNCTELTNSTLSRSKISRLNLKSLTLSGCVKVSDKYLAKFFASCPNLVTINLDGCNVTNYVLKFLASSCNKLRNINLSNCAHISDHGIKTLFKGCPNISALNISNCKAIRGFGIKNCSTNLTHLIADSCWFSPRAIIEIFRIKGLEYLSLSNVREVRVFNEDITVKAEKLKFLNLSNCIYLSCDSLTAIVQGSPLLEELNLAHCGQYLHNGWYALARNCKNLRVLNANCCSCLNFVEDGFIALTGCERLEIIYIRDCFRVEEKDLEEFKVLRPDVAVVRDDECLSFGPCISNLFV